MTLPRQPDRGRPTDIYISSYLVVEGGVKKGYLQDVVFCYLELVPNVDFNRSSRPQPAFGLA